MGLAKRMLEEQQGAQEIGIKIGVRAGVLERCEAHGCYWTTGEGEDAAYRLASAMVRDQDALVAGHDRQEILDGVRDAIQEAGFDGCAHCAKNMKDH